MNKKLQIMISIFILLIMFEIQVSYAIEALNDNSFFTVNAEEISPNETLKIAFNLNKIEYDSFKIVLNSNIDNSEIYTEDNVTLKEQSNAVVIEIDKTKMNLENIEMSYVVPEETEINSKIQLSAKVIIEEETEQQDEEGNTIKQVKTVLEESKEILVIEKKEINDNTTTNNEKQEQNADTSKEQNNNKEDNKEKDNDVNNKQDNKGNGKDANNKHESNNNSTDKSSDVQDNKSSVNMEKSSNNNSNKSTGSQNNKSSANNGKSSNKQNGSSVNSTSKNTNSSGGQSNKSIETATYKGSNNNYLSKLQVKGIDLNTDFNKENTTYFIKVTNTSDLKITATAEDNTAKVVITGNDSIKEGTNKVLISVTAENGDTRYYRIFVNCEISD